MYDAGTVDVVVVGGGHAGVEAALAAARLGCSVVMFCINLDSIAMMPCNPSVGGSSKGHLVRELDALGGEMGKNIDKTFLQSRMLGTGKGPAVHSLRAQADKAAYAAEMKRTLEDTPRLQIRQGEIVDLLVEDGRCRGVVAASGAVYRAGAVVLCTGTYLQARCLFGETIIPSGPNGMMAAGPLSAALERQGLRLLRFKTGTPARIHADSVDYSKMTIQWGDDTVVPFSFENEDRDLTRTRAQLPCYLTYTTPRTHEIIRENLHRSPLYAGVIRGTGPRYCPSIEDKVVRFADKDRHQLFLEPEGAGTKEVYVQGMSSSLPEDVQVEIYRSVIGLEHCQIMRSAYAIEYDCLDATQLGLNLECRSLPGLFGAGQINGSSGYEEAAAQGLMAGINAARSVQGKAPVVLDRSQAYIGVLIDDLVTKGTREPYRMMTSRAEYRLLLRQDNADARLTPLGYELGLISPERYAKFLQKQQAVEAEVARVESVTLAPTPELAELLTRCGSPMAENGVRLADLMKRPELSYQSLAPIDPERPALPPVVQEQVGLRIKYEGYIRQQEKRVEQFKKLEKRALPEELDYHDIHGLRLEAIQKLSDLRPASVGQASRITGVSPADISVLLIYLEQKRREGRK